MVITDNYGYTNERDSLIVIILFKMSPTSYCYPTLQVSLVDDENSKGNEHKKFV